jgi:hypothetical protein
MSNRNDYQRLYESLSPEVRNEITIALEAAKKGIYQRAASFNKEPRPIPIGSNSIYGAKNARIDLAKRTIFDPYYKALKDLEEKYGIKTVLAVEIRNYVKARIN